MYTRVVQIKLLFFIFFWHLKIVCEMKKKNSLQKLHDVKKHLGVATEDRYDFTSTLIIFFLLSWYRAIFIRHLKRVCEIRQKILVKLPWRQKIFRDRYLNLTFI